MPVTVPARRLSTELLCAPFPSQEGLALPPGELSSFLSAVTPSGAAALHMVLWGLCENAELYPLPITKPSAPCREWLRTELEAVRFKHTPLRRQVIRELVELLAPGPSRPDGLPAYAPHAWRLHRHPTKPDRRRAMARRVAAAVACDLGDHDLTDISAKVLGLAGKDLASQGMPARRSHRKPKQARKYRRFGRELLALLGVWPWTHAESGKLPKTWRTDAAFLEPLQAWYERTCGECEQELARCWWAWREAHHPDLCDLPEQPLKGTTNPLEQGQSGHRSEGLAAPKQEDGTHALADFFDELAERVDSRGQPRAIWRPAH